MESGLLSLEDVLAESEKLDLDVSERTFRYYAVLGLLPRPVKRPPGSGDARVHYYEPSILDRLRQIRSLQAEGHSLKQVKKLLEATSGQSPLIRSLADGRFQQACQQFLQASSGQLRDASVQLVRQLQKLTGDNGEPSSREFEACLRQLSQWHSQQQAPPSRNETPSRLEQLADKVRGLPCESGPAHKVQARLLELLAQARHSGAPPDAESLLNLKRLLV
ncbi:MAG: MerR family transcriptional regulator [Candidatus Eremiobacteraeota bacterium]|nr:MerR family transcriptional regulator [Candidatus Eremiobacteraeota bacterium]MCW5871099.1 MerR family transcriptional regulator [Candidatus Eremiobacteraeota bacterium]